MPPVGTARVGRAQNETEMESQNDDDEDVANASSASVSADRSDEGNGGDEETMRILVATDMHVGYAVNDPIRCEDGYNTLDEVLRLSHTLNCDMVLLGGDLFHENKPSRDVVHRVIQLLRKHCFTDKPVNLEFVSDSTKNFEHSKFGTVNYEERNINVGMPVFTIHGNHDDLSGRNLTALDPLHEAGLLNLFGKHTQLDNITVLPILLTKGQTKLALYGLGSQRDDRLYRMFLEHRVQFARDPTDADSWFNLFVLHQNRAKRSMSRSTGNYIPDRILPPFLHLVVWGHEHQCLIDPVRGESNVLGQDDADPNDDNEGVLISQPGSTIATSLSPEEAGDKKVGLLKIRGKKFVMEPITLQTVRQFYFEEVVLDDEEIVVPIRIDRSSRMPDEKLLHDRMEEILQRAGEERRPAQPKLPLVRIRVIYSGAWESVEPVFAQRFGQSYVGRVANTKDVLICKRRAAKQPRAAAPSVDAAKMDAASRQHAQTTVEDIVRNYFERVASEGNEKESLRVLPEPVLSEAVKEFIRRDDAGYLDQAVQRSLDSVQQFLTTKANSHKGPGQDAADDGDPENQFCDDDEEERQFVYQMIDTLKTVRLNRQRAANAENSVADDLQGSEEDEEESMSIDR